MPKTVLIVDDSMSIRETVKLSLQMAGYAAAVAENGERALLMARQTRFDLVVTDLNMPQMDGISLISQLRGIPEYRFTPILMLTTESQEEKKMAGKKAGATGWIVKPVDPAKFLAVIKKVCPL